MNSRERLLAILLIVAMVVIAGGFLGRELILKPLRQSGDELSKLQDEVESLEAKKEAVETEQHIYETKTRKKSLPQEVTVAQREYERLIDHMLRQAKFASPVITPRPADNKGGDIPLLAGKKPAYTKLDFELQVKGELVNLVDFLYTFYRQPLLQQVRKLTINKPKRGGEGANSRELDFTMTIEALVLDRADDRRTLLPALPPVVAVGGSAGAVGFSITNVESGQGTPFTAADVLARADVSYSPTSAGKEYRRIADKNIFFDPPVMKVEPKQVVIEKKPEPEVREREPDLGPNLFITRISHSDGIATALIFDRLRKEDYEIVMNAKGDVKVTHYWYRRVEDENTGAVGADRRRISERPYLQFGSEEGGNLRRYVVHRILENEVLLEPYSAAREKMLKSAAPAVIGGAGISLLLPPKLNLWRVGQFLTSENPKMAVRDVSYNWEKKELLTRRLALENEGEGAIQFDGDGEAPPMTVPGKGSSKRKR